MKMILDTQRQKLLAQGRATAQALAEGRDPPDHKPLVKIFTPDAGCTWLLSEIDPEEPDIAFGLCDIGMGCAELGSVSLSELAALRGHLGLPVERDLHFTAKKTLIAYAREAWAVGRIVA